MPTDQVTTIRMPFPSTWAIHADIAGRPIVWGELIINSIANNRVVGTINFRGVPVPIHGTWDESVNQLNLDSPYATFSGSLDLFDDPPIGIRHFVLTGRFVMKPPSLQAGEYGTWIATTDRNLSEYPMTGDAAPYKSTNRLPPVGVFVTSDLRNRQRL